MLRLPAALGMILLALIAACADADPPGSDAPVPLAGTSWILSEVAVEGALVAAVDRSGSLTFASDGTYSGSTGCNRFTGTWSADGGNLTLQPGPVTQVACEGDLGVQDAAVIAALNATAAYTATGDVLTLLDSAGDALATYTASVSDLTHTSWQATGVNNGNGAVVTTAATAEQTLQFADVATVTGFGGCSTFTGTYTADHEAISITELSPAEPCESATQDEYLAALQAATIYRIDGERLELRDGSGALQAGFVQTG